MSTATARSKRKEECARRYLHAFLRSTATAREECARRYLHAFIKLPDLDYNHFYGMIMRYPNLAKATFEEKLPLHHLLYARAPLPMIQDIFRLNPDAIKTATEDGFLPLHLALRRCCHPEVTTFLLSEFKEASADNAGGWGLPMEDFVRYTIEDLLTNNDGESLSKIFKLLYEAYPPHLWNNRREWSSILVKHIMFNPCDGFPYTLLHWLAKKESEHSQESVLGFFTHDLVRHELEGNNTQAMIQRFNDFVPHLKCKILTLDIDYFLNYDIDVVLSELGKVFSQVAIPPNLALHFNLCRFRLSVDSDAKEHIKDWELLCQLESLSLEDYNMSPNEFKFLIKNLHALPNLRKLSFKDNCYAQKVCTSPMIIELLEAAPCLEFLRLRHVEINVNELVDLLKPSTSTTVVEYIGYGCETEGIPCRRVAYFSSLNHHGRAKINKPNATRELLIQCLCSVDGKHPGRPNLEESLWFGLLREAPALWSGSTDDRGIQWKQTADAMLVSQKTQN